MRANWSHAGTLAGACGIAIFIIGPMVSDVSDAAMADNNKLAVEVNGSGPTIWALQIITSLAAVALVIFGAGLRRRLDEQEPVGSLLSIVAFSGLAVTGATCLVGGGISTELFWAVSRDVGVMDPNTVAAALTMLNTIPWVWAAVGLSAGAVAIGALRHGSAPRWLGWTSAVLTVLVALTQLTPLQYMALLPASVWLVVAGIGLSRREMAT